MNDMFEHIDEDREAQREAEEAMILQEAKDAARCDCQMWDNLPPSAKDYYIREARFYGCSD